MGMWAGIYQGMQDAEKSKLAKEELQISSRRQDQLEKEFAEDQKLKRIKIYVDSVGLTGARNTAEARKTTAEAAEALATNTLLFGNRIESAVQGLSGQDKENLLNFKETISKDPNTASKIMDTLKAYEEKGISISTQELPTLFEIVAITEASGEDPRKTLSELYDLDLSDDVLFKKLLDTVNTYQEAKVVVDFDATKIKGRAPTDITAQQNYMIPYVLRAARTLMESLPDNDPVKAELISQQGKLKSSDEYVRSTAIDYLFGKVVTPEFIENVKNIGGVYFNDLEKNPLISIYLYPRQTGTPTSTDSQELPAQTTYPKPNANQIQMLRDNPGTRDKYDEKFGPGASNAVLQ
jgi:hypothetical protein